VCDSEGVGVMRDKELILEDVEVSHTIGMTIFATCINSGNCHCKSGTVCVRVGLVSYVSFRRMNATESSTLLLHPCRSSMS
jgi:hypothetical protein